MAAACATPRGPRARWPPRARAAPRCAGYSPNMGCAGRVADSIDVADLAARLDEAPHMKWLLPSMLRRPRRRGHRVDAPPAMAGGWAEELVQRVPDHPAARRCAGPGLAAATAPVDYRTDLRDVTRRRRWEPRHARPCGI
ncbi:hypothetical protein [Paracoccus mutanolyticus]|uniref:hypothetical protein n=1 Tax=Paracoccus mutanolyticus TaxID=1499308 RepID=UPI0011AE4DFB|nr:hypothetical protein [Paracoccus mutanolyticus]